MNTLTTLLSGVAIVALTAGGMATIFGLASLRERLVRVALGVFALALLAPGVWMSIRGMAGGAVTGVSGAPAMPFGIVFLIVVGHIALAVFLIKRRVGGERGRHRALELERARLRARPRLPVDPEGDDP